MIPPRINGFDYRGCHRYSLTCCTAQRQPLFRDAETVDLCEAALRAAGEKFGVAVLVYCFMHDHVHVLVEGTNDNADFRFFVKSFRRRSAHAFRTRAATALWQAGYWDRVLRSGDETNAAIRYIACNPVRAGLVTSPMDHPFTGSDVIELSTLLIDVGASSARRG
jgi:putative transposase